MGHSWRQLRARNNSAGSSKPSTARSSPTRCRTGDLAEAQDAVAEVFTVAWRRIADAPAEEAARPWLFAIARRTIANQQRAQRRRLALRERLRLQPASATPGTEDPLDGRQGLHTVLDARRSLVPGAEPKLEFGRRSVAGPR